MLSQILYFRKKRKITYKKIKKKGIINLGGPSQSIYNFAKKYNKKIKKKFSKKEFPKRTDMNLSKLKRIIKNENN